MKKFKVIAVILLITAAGIYFGHYFMNYLALNELKEGEIASGNNIISEAELEDIVQVNTEYLEEIDPDSFNKEIAYSKHRLKLGPFTDYRPQPESEPEKGNDNTEKQEEDEDTTTAEKEPVTPSFKLTGIVGNTTRKLAVIQTADKTIVARLSDRIDDFKIIQIKDDRILLSFENTIHELVIGSDSFENENI